jgi:FKBP-type peptidyl-prolyl cis-trans isomerase 2
LAPGQIINKGDMLMNQAGQQFKVTNVDAEGNVTIDMNHELAGKTLIFKITLKEIQ